MPEMNSGGENSGPLLRQAVCSPPCGPGPPARFATPPPSAILSFLMSQTQSLPLEVHPRPRSAGGGAHPLGTRGEQRHRTRSREEGEGVEWKAGSEASVFLPISPFPDLESEVALRLPRDKRVHRVRSVLYAEVLFNTWLLLLQDGHMPLRPAG